MAKEARTRGARILTQTEVTDILRDSSGAIYGVQTADGVIRTSTVVNAAGMAAPGLAALVGLDLPLFASKGQQVIVSGQGGVVHSAIANPGMVRPMPGGRYMIGGLRERDVDSNTMTLSGLKRLAEIATSLSPALADMTMVGTAPGIRPVPVDGQPVLGGTEQVPGFYFACMHFGLTLAPLSGGIVADIIERRDNPLHGADYEFDRFARKRRHGARS
jgi:sarcosine oxidase subunit beta